MYDMNAPCKYSLTLFLFVQNFTIPGTNSVVQFVFIDTVILAGMTDSLLRHLPPSGPTSIEAAEKEWQWIEDTLRTSTAQWLFVCGHYPGIIQIKTCMHLYAVCQF